MRQAEGRWRGVTMELMAFADTSLDALPKAERDRRLAIARDQHRRSNEEMLRRLGLQ